MKFSNFYNRKRHTPHTRKGDTSFVEIFGKKMIIARARIEYPVEVFSLVVEKKLWVTQRIYQDLLDYLRAIDHPLYYSHRSEFHQKQVEVAKNLQKKENCCHFSTCEFPVLQNKI